MNTNDTIGGRGYVQKPETTSLLLKTAALYILSDWLDCSPAEAARTLLAHHHIPDIDDVLQNINERGRYGLNINATRR